MANTEKIRISKEFKEKIDIMRALHLQKKGKVLTTAEATKIIAKNINAEKIIKNEFE